MSRAGVPAAPGFSVLMSSSPSLDAGGTRNAGPLSAEALSKASTRRRAGRRGWKATCWKRDDSVDIGLYAGWGLSGSTLAPVRRFPAQTVRIGRGLTQSGALGYH